MCNASAIKKLQNVTIKIDRKFNNMKAIYSVYYQAKQIYYGYLDYTAKQQFIAMYQGCIIK